VKNNLKIDRSNTVGMTEDDKLIDKLNRVLSIKSKKINYNRMRLGSWQTEWDSKGKITSKSVYKKSDSSKFSSKKNRIRFHSEHPGNPSITDPTSPKNSITETNGFMKNYEMKRIKSPVSNTRFQYSK
jgi:hypothetical protein